MALAGATPEAVPTGVSPFADYAILGPGPRLGTLGGALLGTSLTLAYALVVGRFPADRVGVRGRNRTRSNRATVRTAARRRAATGRSAPGFDPGPKPNSSLRSSWLLPS
jgi:hypothetical protein